MDSLPVELVTDIAFLACTDGGRTGAALSQVSRHIRDATHPARFHSVSLASDPDRLVTLLSTLKAQRDRIPNTTARTRHLFLSLLPLQEQPVFRFPPIGLPALATAYGEHFVYLASLGRKYGRTVSDIVKILASELETFTFIRGDWRHVPVVRCTFPRLREFTIVDGCPEFLRLDDAPPCFPQMERLHVVHFMHAVPMSLPVWAHHAPTLAHIRIHGLHHQDVRSLDLIRSITGSQLSKEEKLPFPDLAHVIVQPVSAAARKGHDAPGVDNELLLALRDCAEKAPRGLRFDIPLSSAHYQWCDAGQKADTRAKTLPEFCIRMTRNLWLERVEGGIGCWSSEYVT